MLVEMILVRKFAVCVNYRVSDMKVQLQVECKMRRTHKTHHDNDQHLCTKIPCLLKLPKGKIRILSMQPHCCTGSSDYYLVLTNRKSGVCFPPCSRSLKYVETSAQGVVLVFSFLSFVCSLSLFRVTGRI
ncbi:unnamed protein product [Amoebophrya sp. A120]|nr:unnamed protein product [Amoebophrya sp. A120]|eukprot:GSA120T00007536001.1